MNIKRLLIIDKCLRNDQQRWTLDDLIDACKSTEKNSKRSVQADIETLRKVYHAPIAVRDRKYYEYSDKSYLLTNASLSPMDREALAAAIESLADYCDFQELEGVEKYLGDLYQYLSSRIVIPAVARFAETKSLKPTTVRLWISDEIADKIRNHPIHASQWVEQEEIDGSIDIVLQIPLTSDFENFLMLNSHQIRVIYPTNLINQIKKLEVIKGGSF